MQQIFTRGFAVGFIPLTKTYSNMRLLWATSLHHRHRHSDFLARSPPHRL